MDVITVQWIDESEVHVFTPEGEWQAYVVPAGDGLGGELWELNSPDGDDPEGWYETADEAISEVSAACGDLPIMVA